MSDLPMGWEMSCNDRTINAKHLRAVLKEIQAYREERLGDEPQEEGAA